MRWDGHPSLVRVISNRTGYKHELTRMAARVVTLRSMAGLGELRGRAEEAAGSIPAASMQSNPPL
jgi:hypothetical protein